ncbi:MAG: PQQ-dependent sugar dehydrogenase [Caldilineaceae bacterium]|nr:PQQ-dependent sugar dehydrogenase [Caldilineaceae bacterium]HRJ42074.1 hypothetical protein [Caldilineaceae bacterium]
MSELQRPGTVSLPWRYFLFILGTALLLAGCSQQPLLVVEVTPVAVFSQPVGAQPALASIPLPPKSGPDSQGGGGLFRPLEALADAVACLSDGQPVYGVMQANANVRTQPAVDGCRLGRAPAGTVVRIEGLYSQGQETPFLSLNRLEAETGYPAVGYTEDIQPLFASTCAICHGELVQNGELKVTDYASLLAGSQRGAVVVPGKPEESFLWYQVSAGVMPLAGTLSRQNKQLIYDWIRSGAPESRPAAPVQDEVWLRISPTDYNPAANECDEPDSSPQPFINSTLVRFASCVAGPPAASLADYLPRSQQDGRGDVDKIVTGLISRPFGMSALQGLESAAPVKPATVKPATESAVKPLVEAAPAQASQPVRQQPAPSVAPGKVGISASPLGLPAPSDDDPWMIPQGGFCVEQHLQTKLEEQRGITSLAFAPDGRLFLGLDSPTTGPQDPNILFDAFHPSRSIGVYNSNGGESYSEILTESERVTGMVWRDGVLYLNRAGEVGRIVDGGRYERLAAGFSVDGRLFHANNGIALVGGWLYVSAGGVRDGYSDGLIAPGDGDVPAESLATSIAGGNPYGSRIVRARVERLVAERNISAFQTAARGVRNPYGLTADPQGRLWFTDNGATNVPGDTTAGDEVNFLDPNSLAAAGDESATPYYGFPLALANIQKDWWSGPVLPLLNTAAPTGITWAYGTIFYAQYGRDPGLYRVASSGGRLVGERVLLGWPIQAVTTAPDGALWVGTGSGGLYRITPGCG